MASGVKIDLSRTILRSGHKNYEVRVADLEAWEAAHDVIPDSAVVLIRTGWDKRNKTTRSYSGLDQHNKLNFPGLSVEAAEWIVAHQEKHNHKEGIIGVGIDTLSLDIGQSFDYPVHVKLLNYSIYGIENLHNLDLLPDKDFYVTVLPMRIGGGSGAPARIVAETGETISMHALAPPRPAACLALVIAALTSLYLHTL